MPQPGNSAPATPLAIALAGAASLAVAMGIGRFAFTPLLPMMLHEGLVDLRQGSELATANYVGYLAGAMLAAAQPWLLARFDGASGVSASTFVRWGLLATALLTAAMAVHAPLVWPLLRALAGFTGAYVLVFTSGWCLAHLARHDRSALGGIIFAGPGIGIAISGVFVSALIAWHASAAWGWLSFGLLAAVLTALVWPIVQGSEPAGLAMRDRVAPARHGSTVEVALLVLAYGLEGFGYIVTGTFLPVIARELLPASIWLNLFWPIFGLAAVAGALLSVMVPNTIDKRHALAVTYLIQAAGIALTVVAPSVAGFAAGSLLAGLPFTVITLFAMQEARRFRPRNAAGLMGILSAVYGIGQISGPPFAALLLAHSATPAQGFAVALGIASVSLAVGAAIFVVMAQRWPLPKA